LAGYHGEGFKVGAMVTLREGYAAHISASEYYWKFQWGKSDNNMLHCNITEPKDRVLKAERDAYNGAIQKDVEERRKHTSA